MIKRLYKFLKREYTFATYILKPFKWLYEKYKYYLMSERKYLEINFLFQHGYPLNIDAPRSLNEKIQWLKLNDRSELHTKCADKIAVRDYVKNTIGEKYLIPLLYTTKNPHEIDGTKITDYPVIIKTNHNSGGNFIITDARYVDFENIRSSCKVWLKSNHYYRNKEWQYKNIKPQLLIEKLLVDEYGNVPKDYKFHCFNGKVLTIQVDGNRGTSSHYRNWYNRDWVPEEFSWCSIMIDGYITKPNYDEIVERPINLKKVIDLAEKLSNPFYYARVDFYIIYEDIFFGEITFHHDGGFRPIEPREWDYKLGEKLNLPISNEK